MPLVARYSRNCGTLVGACLRELSSASVEERTRADRYPGVVGEYCQYPGENTSQFVGPVLAHEPDVSLDEREQAGVCATGAFGQIIELVRAGLSLRVITVHERPSATPQRYVPGQPRLGQLPGLPGVGGNLSIGRRPVGGLSERDDKQPPPEHLAGPVASGPGQLYDLRGRGAPFGDMIRAGYRVAPGGQCGGKDRGGV